MTSGKKTSLRIVVRTLHRYVGFFAIGITIVFCLSGLTLIYRDTGFMKSERLTEKQLEAGLSPQELGKALRFRNFKVTEVEGDVLHFNVGTYNKATGVAQYTRTSLPPVLEAFVGLHKSPSKSPAHWLTLLFGCMLLFLAVSSFWMITPSRLVRSLSITAAGVVCAIVVLVLR